MPGEIGEIAKSFLAKKKSQLVSSITVQVYNRMLGRLISFLSIKEVTSLSKMSEPLLLEFLSSSQSNPSQRVMVVRGFCQYLVQEGLVPALTEVWFKAIVSQFEKSYRRYIHRKRYN